MGENRSIFHLPLIRTSSIMEMNRHFKLIRIMNQIIHDLNKLVEFKLTKLKEINNYLIYLNN